MGIHLIIAHLNRNSKKGLPTQSPRKEICGQIQVRQGRISGEVKRPGKGLRKSTGDISQNSRKIGFIKVRTSSWKSGLGGDLGNSELFSTRRDSESHGRGFKRGGRHP